MLKLLGVFIEINILVELNLSWCSYDKKIVKNIVKNKNELKSLMNHNILSK